MDISRIGKADSIQPQAVQDPQAETVKNAKSKEQEAGSARKVDSAEISGHTGTFEDKRLTVAKSALLCDVTVNSPDDRITEIRRRIDRGEYHIPSDRIASAMLDE